MYHQYAYSLKYNNVNGKVAGHGSRVVWGMHCLRSLGSRDRGLEPHSGHRCLVFVCMCAFFCVYMQVEALRRADHTPKESYRSETESFMEVG
jgi:hypothetical protein